MVIPGVAVAPGIMVSEFELLEHPHRQADGQNEQRNGENERHALPDVVPRNVQTEEQEALREQCDQSEAGDAGEQFQRRHGVLLGQEQCSTQQGQSDEKSGRIAENRRLLHLGMLERAGLMRGH